MNSLRISLFGRFQLCPTDRVNQPRFPPICRQLLAYLLLHPNQQIGRDQILDTFWGEQSEQRARNCLNTALWRIRGAFRSAQIESTKYLICAPEGDVGFNWESDYWLDTQRFEKHLSALLAVDASELSPAQVEAIDRALALYQGELLEDVYADWALRERERLRGLYLRGLEQLMDYYTCHADYRAAISQGERIVQLDPLNEGNQRALTRLYVQCGKRIEALQQYHNFQALLDDELGVQPMEETQLLYMQIKTDQPLAVSQRPRGSQLTLREATAQVEAATQVLAGACRQVVEAVEVLARTPGMDK